MSKLRQKHLKEEMAQLLDEHPLKSIVLLKEDLKNFLETEKGQIEKMHHNGEKGKVVAKAWSQMMDILLEKLFYYALKYYSKEFGAVPCPICIVALGGYGRDELCPLSDIDIMFLYPDEKRSAKLNSFLETTTNTILYLLWDFGLKVGHSTRTIKEALQEAKKTLATRNALLETRLVSGSKVLYNKFQKHYQYFHHKEAPKAYLQDLLTDQKERRSYYGGTPFLQEPEIKNGVGGLRDYQNLLWIAEIRLKEPSIEALVKADYMSAKESNAILDAYDFILRVRHALHFQSKRSTDLLALEKQPNIAWDIGYRHEDIFERTKIFMKDYYCCAQTIFRLSQFVEGHLFLDKKQKNISFKTVIESHSSHRWQSIDGFLVINAKLYSENDNVFEEQPERLIRIFRHAQQLKAELNEQLLSLIHKNLYLIDNTVIHSSSANKSFGSILQSAGNVYPTLKRMHEIGILQRFLPEFGGISCLIQHEYYHRYTVDIHTLNTIKQLDRIFANEEEITRKYHHALHQTKTPTLLYLILLLHDIGKVYGTKNHAQKGVTIAMTALDRMSISPENKKQILFIIDHHLEMTRIWQRSDVDDPQTGLLLASLVENDNLLGLLYVHTFCDTCGTAENIWNNYKDALHTRLFENTLQQLKDNKTIEQRRQENKCAISVDQLKTNFPELDEKLIHHHLNEMPESYFIHNKQGEVTRHLHLISDLRHSVNEKKEKPKKPLIDWKNDLNLSMTVVDFISWDRAGLFYKIAGAFSITGVNIVSSRAFVREDHIAIDTFYVSEPNGGIIQDPKVQHNFEKQLHRILNEEKKFSEDFLQKAQKRTHSLYLKSKNKRLLPVESSVNIFYEPSLHRNVIEIQAEDRLGLLYELAKAIYNYGFDITFARIATECHVAIDTFHIEKIDKTSTLSSDLLLLRQGIEPIVHPKT